MTTCATDWKIPVNLAKTSALLFGSGIAPDYRFSNIAIRQADIIKDLGMLMNKHLKFDAQVDVIVRKAFSVLCGTTRSIIHNDSAILLKLYKAYAYESKHMSHYACIEYFFTDLVAVLN